MFRSWRNPGVAVVALVALALLGTTRGARAADSPGQSRTGIPTSPVAGPHTAPRRFQPTVNLVKLDSCDPAVLAKPPRTPKNIVEAAEWDQARADLERYHAILEAYAGGDAASSVDSVLALSRDTLTLYRDRLTRVLLSINKRGIDLHAPWDAQRYTLAVMLHTDAALRLGGDSYTYGNDAYDQFQVAADLLQLGVRCAPDRFTSLAPRWYVALSRLLRDHNALRAAEALLELGRKRLDNEPAVFYESGLLAESIATIYALSQPEPRHSWAGGDSRVVRRIDERRRAWLDDAATWLGRAAALEPGNDEVALHLGRVRALRFDDVEALSTLGAVLDRTQSNDLAYLAAIFIGAVHDRQGRLDDAAAAYRASLERVPGGHAGQVGLVEVLRRSGRLDEARGQLRALVTKPSEEMQEPLWWYILEPPGMADRRLVAMRAEVRQ